MNKIKSRSKLFVLKRFQVRYITMILIFTFVIALISGYTVYVTTWIIFGEKLAAVYPQGLLLDIVKKVNTVLLLRLLFLTPLVALIGLFLSNKIAGPIYRIKKSVKSVKAGNYDSMIKLREKDELHDLADEINSLVYKLKDERTLLRGKLDELKKETMELEEYISSKTSKREDLLIKVRDMRQRLETLGSG